MSFRSRIVLGLIAVGLLPVCLMGWLSYQASREELLQSVGRAQTRTVNVAARSLDQVVAHAVHSLELAVSYLPLQQKLTTDELRTMLAIPYRQVPAVDVLALLDRDGNALAPPLFEPDPPPAGSTRRGVSQAHLDAFSEHIPLAQAMSADQPVVGPPYQVEGAPRVAVVLRLAGEPRRALAAELSLDELRQQLQTLAEPGDRAFAVDAQGAVIAQTGEGGSRSVDEQALIDEGLRSAEVPARVVTRADGPYLAAIAPLASLRWALVVERPAAEAFSTADRLRRYSLFWAGVAVALIGVLGLLLSRGLSRPLAELLEGARGLTEGKYDRKVPVRSRDELGLFAEAFNHMASEIQRRDQDIRGWNEELRKRVEERTAELRSAHDQIERTRRLAAVASMAAGVAHELNNPLTAIIGLADLIKADVQGLEQVQMLDGIVAEAERIARIVQAVRELPERERPALVKRFSLAGSVKHALEIYADQLHRRRIAVHTEIAPSLPEVEGDPAQIRQVIGHLVQNAISAMPEGGDLRVSVGSVDDGVLRVTIKDTGVGIPAKLQDRIFDPFFTTKRDGGQVGLGLSLSHTIVQAHHGKIIVESSEGQGATFTVLLPSAGAPAHLA